MTGIVVLYDVVISSVLSATSLCLFSLTDSVFLYLVLVVFSTLTVFLGVPWIVSLLPTFRKARQCSRRRASSLLMFSPESLAR